MIPTDQMAKKKIQSQGPHTLHRKATTTRLTRQKARKKTRPDRAPWTIKEDTHAPPTNNRKTFISQGGWGIYTLRQRDKRRDTHTTRQAFFYSRKETIFFFCSGYIVMKYFKGNTVFKKKEKNEERLGGSFSYEGYIKQQWLAIQVV